MAHKRFQIEREAAAETIAKLEPQLPPDAQPFGSRARVRQAQA
jgi:hypothetical protein